MENTLEIQKEFEILISELERLKSVNELTTVNANSAKVVVNEIEKFVKAVELFKATITQDHEIKNSKIDLILAKLEVAISSITNETKNCVIEYSNDLKVLHEKSDSVLNENRVALSIELTKFADALSNLSESLSLVVGSTSSNILVNMQNQREQIDSQIKRSDKVVENHLNSVETKLAEKLLEIQELIEKNNIKNSKIGLITVVSAIVTLGLLIAFLVK